MGKGNGDADELDVAAQMGLLYELELQDRAKLRAKMRAAETTVHDLDDQLKPLQKKIEGLRSEVVKSQKESMALRNTLRIKNKDNERARKEVAVEQDETKQLRDRLIKAHERMHALEQAVKAQGSSGGPKHVNSSIRVLAASCEELHKRLAGLRQEIRSNSPSPQRNASPKKGKTGGEIGATTVGGLSPPADFAPGSRAGKGGLAGSNRVHGDPMKAASEYQARKKQAGEDGVFGTADDGVDWDITTPVKSKSKNADVTPSPVQPPVKADDEKPEAIEDDEAF